MSCPECKRLSEENKVFREQYRNLGKDYDRLYAQFSTVLNQPNHRITVGEYTIMPFHGDSFFIEHESGEGMQVSLSALEKLVDDFYKENF